jgi:hypothetical protein
MTFQSDTVLEDAPMAVAIIICFSSIKDGSTVSLAKRDLTDVGISGA